MYFCSNFCSNFFHKQGANRIPPKIMDLSLRSMIVEDQQKVSREFYKNMSPQ